MNIDIDVPYFQQSRFNTCGPAALMMVIKYWAPSFEFTLNNESKISRNSNTMLFLGGSLQYGIATTAAKMGFKTEIYQKTRFFQNYSNFKNFFKIYEMLSSYNARILKIPIYHNINLFEIIKKALNKNIPPLVMLNLKPIIGENIYHWLVVNGMKEKKILVNDPYVPIGSKIEEKKSYPVDLIKFKKAISIDPHNLIRVPASVVLVFK